jgi:hypothetical protein
MLFTLISLVVLTEARLQVPAYVACWPCVDSPNLLWLALAIVCVHLVALAHTGIVYPMEQYARALASVLLAGFTTSLWYGAIVNGTGDS